MDGPRNLKGGGQCRYQKNETWEGCRSRQHTNSKYSQFWRTLGLTCLTKLLNSIYDSGKIPKDLASNLYSLLSLKYQVQCYCERYIEL